MYEFNSILISVVLFVIILLANEAGRRLGKPYREKASEHVKSHTTAIQAGILGLLALLLGFTFSMAIERYDDRFKAQINEATSIRTALLRTKLLPDAYQTISNDLIQKYIDIRLHINEIDLTEIGERNILNQKTEIIQDQIWKNASAAVDVDSRTVTTGLYVRSLNEMIDTREKRNAIIQQHVPETIFYLLFVVIISTGAILGYSAGLGNNSVRFPSVIFTVLIVIVVFIIIDLDRPKRSVIKLNQESISSLKNELKN